MVRREDRTCYSETRTLNTLSDNSRLQRPHVSSVTVSAARTAPSPMDPSRLLVVLLCWCANAEWDCATETGRGQCVLVNKCEPLMAKLTGPERDSGVFEILKKYNCGYENNDPKVCCPASHSDKSVEIFNSEGCSTSQGGLGTCTKLEECADMIERVKNNIFLSEENVDFIKRSKCTPPGSSKTSYVCCKSKLDNRMPPSQTTDQDQCSLSAFPPHPDSSCCGTEGNSDSRIIGGAQASIDQFPWLVMIEYTRIGFSCGGSLISGKYVLTAAHCLVGSKGRDRSAVSVRLGEYNTTNPGRDCVETAGGGLDCSDGDISVPIESYVVHEGYDTGNVLKYHDIALIRLKETVNYTDFIRPICLPSSDFTKSAPDGLNFFISGWGIYDDTQQLSSEIKLYAKVPYVRKEQCNERYLKLGKQSLADTQLCVGGETNRDSCKGDSGGPLMFLNNLTYEAVGVISFGTSSCGLQNWPSIYTKVYDYLDWIKANIKP